MTLMIKANHKSLYVWFFHLYSRWMLKWHFREVKLHMAGMKAPDKPVLLIGNHFSWWDGFIADYLNHSLFRKKMFIMMLEEQLKRRMFLNRAGAFSVRKGTRSSLESLQYAINVLRDNNNLLVMYPQGKIQSMHRRPLEFEQGINKILKEMPDGTRVFFYMALIDYFTSRNPRLDIYLKEHQVKDLEQLEQDFNKFADNSVSQQK